MTSDGGTRMAKRTPRPTPKTSNQIGQDATFARSVTMTNDQELLKKSHLRDEDRPKNSGRSDQKDIGNELDGRIMAEIGVVAICGICTRRIQLSTGTLSYA